MLMATNPGLSYSSKCSYTFQMRWDLGTTISHTQKLLTTLSLSADNQHKISGLTHSRSPNRGMSRSKHHLARSVDSCSSDVRLLMPFAKSMPKRHLSQFFMEETAHTCKNSKQTWCLYPFRFMLWTL